MDVAICVSLSGVKQTSNNANSWVGEVFPSGLEILKSMRASNSQGRLALAVEGLFRVRLGPGDHLGADKPKARSGTAKAGRPVT
jgi:hypothetical protein